MARPPNFPLPLGHFPGGMFPSPGPFPPGLMFPAVPGPALIPGMGNFVPRHGFRPPFLQPASFGPGALPPRGPPPRHAGPMVPGQGRGTPPGPRPRGPWAQERRQGNFAQGNRQQRKKAQLSKDDTPFYCDSCDRGFKTDELLKKHCETHIQCFHEGCPYVAAEKLVKLHHKLTHLSRFSKALSKLDTPEAIAKWREERKKNYPTVANVAKKVEDMKKRRDRGEVLDTREFG
ncbi:FMR1-interacting protein NUFIP1-like [Branchiostoma lanceolatum]|uniref:FMR1-interacting protein NUFIP1-like n=1 Tax=Branchiostoma lanceolatum TaxID=7740 RepID=UPI003451D1CB